MLLLALNRSTRLSVIKTGRVGAIGIDGRAPKTEGDESEERVFHSAKGFTLVEVNMVVFLVLFEIRARDVENSVCLELKMENYWETVLLKYLPVPTRRYHSGGTEGMKHLSPPSARDTLEDGSDRRTIDTAF